MKNMLRRPIAMLLAMVMILSCVPMEGLAAIVPVNGPTTSSDGISLFSIVQPPVATYTYNFVNGETTVSTQIVKDGESLLDPGTPESKDVHDVHKEFVGWYTAAEGGTQFTSFGEIEIADGAESQTITLYARFKTVYFVFFEDSTGRIIHTEKGEPGDKIQTSVGTAAYPLSGEENLTGWKVKGTDNTTDEVTLNNNTDIHLTAVVSKGHWITFDSQGGSYVEPKFVEAGSVGTVPAAPTRPGYTFDHWSKEDGSEYDWSQTVDDSLTLYAVWTANTDTQYTVIHWIENANDDGYSFGASTTGTGTTGTDTHAEALTEAQWKAAGIDKNDNRTDWNGFTAQSITQKTIAGDGSTIVDVYYKRNEYSIYFWNDSNSTTYTCGKESHTHSRRSGCYNRNGQLTCTKEEHTHAPDCVSTTGGLYTNATITAKYGANISDQWPTVNDSSTWKVEKNGSKYQANIDTMPLYGDNFYGPQTKGNYSTASYYLEVLPGETGTVHNGVTYELHHSDTSYGGSDLGVTDEDKYPITGFTYKELSANVKSNYGEETKYYYNGAKFYYTRNSYNIVYVSGGKTVNTESYKYEQSIADAGEYKPTAKPEGLDDAYTFEGWYADPECTKKYVFAADAKMPAENITVYAKWAAPVFEGTIYLTIEGTDEPVKVEVPYGGTLEETLAEKQAEIMKRLGNGYEWHCWKTLDGTTFNPSTQIYANITLTPYYTSTACFTVSYDTKKDDVTASDGKKYAQNSYADIAAPSALTSGNQTFLGWKVQGDKSNTLYQPRQKYLIKGDVIFEAVWGNTPATVTLTYHSNYQSVAGTTLEEKTQPVNDIPNNGTVNAAAGTIFTAPTGYEFGGWAMTATATKADVEAGAAILIDNNGSNDLYAVWTKDADQKHSVSYTVRYYQQNDNGGYDEMTSSAETHTETGWIGEAVEIKVSVNTTKDLPAGYAFEQTNPATLPEKYTVAAYGTSSTDNVIKVYYKKNQFTVSYEYTGTVPSDATTLPKEASYKYGETVTVAAAATAAGYTFSGWSTTDATIASGEFIMPANNVNITGSWSIDDDQTVPVTYKAEGNGTVINASDNIQIVNANGLTGSTATAKSGYKFVGWYKGETKVSDAAVLDVPTAKANLNKDNNNNYAATEFVAKFERDFENGGDDGQFKFSVAGCEKMYDGKAYTVTISGLIAGEDYVSFSTDGTTWTEPVAWDGTIPENLKYTNVGEYPVYVKAKNGDVESQKNATVKITPRPVTITANSATLLYTGEAQQAVGKDGKLYTVSGTNGEGGLLEGHTISGGYVTGTGTAYIVLYRLKDAASATPRTACTYVGEYTASVYPEVQIVSGSKNVTGNYDITLVPGLLKITGAELNPSKKVDGKPADEKSYKLGEVVYFTITVTNLSAEPVKDVVVVDADEIIAQQDVVEVEKQADGTYKATIKHIGSGPLAENTVPGNVVTLTVKHVVTEADILAVKYTNTATITGDKEYTVTADVDKFEEPNPALTVTKRDGEEDGYEYKLGDTIEYTITVTNTGNLTISNVVVTDQKTGATFDANDAYAVGTDAAGHSIATLKAALAPNASVTLTAKYTVTEDDILNGDDNNGKLVNVATASGKDPNGGDPDVTPGQSEDDIVDKKNGLSVTKRTTSTPTDEELGKYKLGEKITYDIEVKNTGNQTITDIVVTDNLADATIIAGDGYTVEENKAKIASLAPNASVTVKAEYTVTEADVLAGSVKNTATATGDAPDKSKPEGTGETTDTTVEPNAHFSLKKTLTNLPNKGYFTVGETAEFDVVVTNDGNVTLTNVNVFEKLTGAAFTAVAKNESNAEVTLNGTLAVIESLAPGKSVTLKAVYTVTAEDLGNKDLKNVVTGSGKGPGTDPENPINPPEDKNEENIPVDDAVIVKITKKWDDEENKYESRPESVSFTLYQSVDKENSAIGKLVVSEETDWTAESGRLPAHTKDGAEIHYTLTENEVTGYDWNYTVQLPPSADTNEQLPPQDDQAHEAEVVEQPYTVTNTLKKHKLTIRYWKYAVGGEKVTGDYSAEYAYNAPYSVQSPDLYGWDADMSRVEGRMPDEDLVVDVVYRQLIYKLTIYYIFEDGTTAHKEYEAKLTAGEKFAVESPEIEGYKPNLWMISGEMPARDLNYTVIYMAQNTPVDLSAATAPLGIGNVVPNAGDCFD